MLIALSDIQNLLNTKEYNNYLSNSKISNEYYAEDLNNLYSLVAKNGFAIFNSHAKCNLLSIIHYMRKNFGANIKDSGVDKKYLAKIYPNPLKKYYINSGLAQPLHTDEGYRNTFPHYVSLYCVIPDTHGGVSVLVDGRNLIAYLNSQYKELLPLAFKTDFMHLETAVGKICKPLLFYLPDKSIGISYSPILKQIHSDAEGLCLISAVNDYIHSPSNQIRIKLKAKELLVVNNCRMLHGRTEFNPSNKRLLLRLWNGEISL